MIRAYNAPSDISEKRILKVLLLSVVNVLFLRYRRVCELYERE